MFIPEFGDHRDLEEKTIQLKGIQEDGAQLIVKGLGKTDKDMTLKACKGKIITNDNKVKVDKCFDGTYYEKFTKIKN
jgi:hypothetical protein|tara:strand:+ start:291 stop:521 length:231 start_codon:yes stop_codon:yes gene_type:complete